MTPARDAAVAARMPAWLLIVEQALNGLQFGLMLFLLAAGLTLVFGIMDMINLAHGSLYMVGAFLAAWLVELTGSFAAGVLLAVPATALFGMAARGRRCCGRSTSATTCRRCSRRSR